MVVILGKWAGKTAVVTGANSGIGAAVTNRLLEEGLTVVGLDIHIDKLEERALRSNNALHVIKTDVTEEDQILNAFIYVKKNLGPIQVLVNCAGIFPKNTIIDGNTKKWRSIMDINVLAVCITGREAFNNMKEHEIHDGHIINFCSIAGHVVLNIPGLNLYSVSKYAVKALTETLRNELIQQKSTIKVSSISPGCVRTPIFENPDIRDKILSGTVLDPEDVAEAVIYMLSTPPHVQVQDMIIRPVGEQL